MEANNQRKEAEAALLRIGRANGLSIKQVVIAPEGITSKIQMVPSQSGRDTAEMQNQHASAVGGPHSEDSQVENQTDEKPYKGREENTSKLIDLVQDPVLRKHSMLSSLLWLDTKNPISPSYETRKFKAIDLHSL